MSRRRHTPEQIITALREAEVGLAGGKTVGMVSGVGAWLGSEEIPPVPQARIMALGGCRASRGRSSC